MVIIIIGSPSEIDLTKMLNAPNTVEVTLIESSLKSIDFDVEATNDGTIIISKTEDSDEGQYEIEMDTVYDNEDFSDTVSIKVTLKLKVKMPTTTSDTSLVAEADQT